MYNACTSYLILPTKPIDKADKVPSNFPCSTQNSFKIVETTQTHNSSWHYTNINIVKKM